MNNKEKTINIVVIGFIVFACIIFGFLIYNLFFLKNNDGNSNYNQNDLNDNKYIEISLDDYVAKVLIEKVNFESFVLANLYFTEQFTAQSIDTSTLLCIGYSKISGDWDNDLANGNIYSEDGRMYRKIYPSDLDKNIKNLFGDNVTYMHRSFNAAMHGLTDALGGVDFVEYDFNNNYYITEFEQGGGMNPVARQNIYKVEKNDNSIRLYANIYFMYKGENTIYKDYIDNDGNFEKFLNPQSCTNIDECSDKLNQYVYTFEKSDDNYYLNSFKKISE